MKTRILTLLLVAGLLPCGSFAITVQVDPVAGTDNGSSPFQTIGAALTAVAGADAGDDVVNVRSNGVNGLSAAITINVAAADGNLTIQLDPGDTGSAVVRLAASGGPLLTINVDGGQTLDVSGLSFIGGTGTGALGGDGSQIFNSNSGGGIATINFTDCVFAANDGTDNPVPYAVSASTVGTASFPGDDWLDYFADTAGTLTNVKISHCADEGLIVRGSQNLGETGANVTLTGDSVISYCGGRAIQLPFQADASDTPLTFNAVGTVDTRVRLVGNSEAFNEPIITAFNGNVSLQYVDIVSNNSFGMRVDTDTCDSFSMQCCRVAFNTVGMAFLFASGDLSLATINDCTFHDQTTPNGVNNVEQAIEVNAATTTVQVDVTDSIFTGFNDRIDIQTGTTAVVNFDHCAVVIQDPDSLGLPAFSDLLPTSEVATIGASPFYVSTTFDVTDPQNPDFLRVTDRNSEYLTGSSTGGELQGGACLPLVNNPPPLSTGSSWTLYD